MVGVSSVMALLSLAVIVVLYARPRHFVPFSEQGQDGLSGRLGQVMPAGALSDMVCTHLTGPTGRNRR